MQKYVENTGKNPMYVGNTMIPPGEGKLVEVPERAAAPVAAPPQGPNLVELTATLLDKPLAQILPDLPGMTNEALDLAESQEGAGKNRKTLITAIQAERIARANAKLDGAAAAEREKAQHDAANELLSARVAQLNQPPDATEEARTLAQQAVDEAQAKVNALKPAE